MERKIKTDWIQTSGLSISSYSMESSVYMYSKMLWLQFPVKTGCQTFLPTFLILPVQDISVFLVKINVQKCE